MAIAAAKRGAHVTIIARDLKRLEETTLEISKAVVDSSQKVQHLSRKFDRFPELRTTVSPLSTSSILQLTSPVTMLLLKKHF